jgi:hypothetical protein
MKKIELETIHQLTKNTIYTCIADPCSMITKYDQLEMVLDSFNLAR